MNKRYFTPKKTLAWLMVLKGVALIVIIGLAGYVIPAHARDLGVYGDIYPIQEQDLLEYIKAKLLVLKNSGELAKMQSHQLDQTKAHADRPKAVPLVKATRDNTWFFDPSIKAPYDLTDASGQVFAKAGVLVNPLTVRPFNEVLVFFDGDDKQQVAWAKTMDALLVSQHTLHKLILVNGSITEQVKRFHQAIYFDQQGKITQHFGIQKVPCLLKQSGLKLQIAEVKV